MFIEKAVRRTIGSAGFCLHSALNPRSSVALTYTAR